MGIRLRNDHSIKDNTELVPRESWELVNKGKKELEENVKQIEKRILKLQQLYQQNYLLFTLIE